MAKQDPTVPVYLITGFLDGGKTRFLKQTLARFHIDKTVPENKN